MVGVGCMKGAGPGSKAFISGTRILLVTFVVLNSEVETSVSNASLAEKSSMEVRSGDDLFMRAESSGG